MRTRGIDNGGTLCRRLLEETGVAILPGSDFGQSIDDRTARLAYVDFDGRAAIAAAHAVSDDQAIDNTFVRQYCAPTVEAVERLVRWVVS